jgi:predicted  nucleic acid-binding Zn-ribbon protein
MDEVNAAQKKLQSVTEAMTRLVAQLDEQKKALESQRSAEENLKKSESELKAAVDDLENQERTYKTQVETLEKKSQDANASTVSKSKAAAGNGSFVLNLIS